jgi:hypothetical protein
VHTYELQQTIAPGDQMWVNLGQLIQQRVPDRNGNFLPVDVNTVTYDVQELSPGGHNLIANDLTVNPSAGQAIPNYPRCCPYSDYYYSPNYVQFIYDGSAPYLIDAIDSCNGTPYSIIDDFTSFSSSNTSVAQFTKGLVQAVGVGQATGTAHGWLLYDGCVLVPVTAYEPIDVQPRILLGGPGGTDITNKPQSVVVGQQIILYGDYLPSGVTVNSQSWSVPGTIVGGFNGVVTNGGSTTADLSQRSTTFYWVTAANSQTLRANISWTVLVPLINEQ